MNDYCRAFEPVADVEGTKTTEQASQCRARTFRRARLASIKKKYRQQLRTEVNLSQRHASIKEKSQAAVFKDVNPEEISEYKKLFPNLENISERTIHCTTCNLHIGTAPINEDRIKMHPLLRVIQCKKCYKFCTSEEFDLGADGYEIYCRWCGQGGEVYCCSQCPKVFCRCCIQLNLSIAQHIEIQMTEDWICFVCDPSTLTQLKADYWALMNFIAKQKKAITNETLTDNELNLAMRKDCSTCCTKIKFLNGKRGLPHIITYSNSYSKRRRMDVKPPTILNNVLDKLAESKIPVIRCANDPPITNTIIKTSPINYRVVVQSDSEKPVQAKLMHNVLATTRAKKNGFNTINGVQLDLNKVTQQETYRLKDGKLIKVRKRQPMPLPVNASKTSSKVTPLELTTPKTDYTSLIITDRPEFIRQGFTLNQPLFKGEKPKKPGCPAPTLIDRAKVQFELRVKNSLEVCQHITGKMKMLTNSTSFKSVKTQSDIKDLIIHLSYLLSYAGSRFKTIQEKCDDDLKVMGFDPDPNSSKSDDNDIEILEPTTALIELDSDENDADDLRWETKKDVDNLVEIKNVEPIKLELNEIVKEVSFIHQNDELINNATLTEAVLMNSNDYIEIPDETNGHNIDVNSIQNKEGRDLYNQIVQSFTICEKSKEISLAVVHYNEVTGESSVTSFNKGVITIQKEDNEGLMENFQPNGDADTTLDYKKVYTSRSTGREQTDEDNGATTTGFIKNLLRNVSCPLELPENKFQSLYRLSKESFKYLLDMIQPKFRTSRKGIPPILKLASTLRVLASGSYQLNIGEVLNILDSCFTSFVHFDQSEEELIKCKRHYYANTGLPGVRGCIDGTHINIIRPAKNEQYFCKSQGVYSINVMATCDDKLCFTSVVAHHGGCLTDSSIWSKCSERLYLENLYRKGDKSSWLLGDSDYPLEPWLMTPYKYAVDGTKEINFNEYHSKGRETIKTCFSLLKSRFRCLSNAKSLNYKPEKAAQIIRVSCLLHNICVRFNVEFNENLLVDEEYDKEDFNNTVNIRTSHTLLTEAKRIRDELSKDLGYLHNKRLS